MHKTRALVAIAAIASAVAAQSNTVAGLDGRLTNISSLTYYGRQGAAHPGGQVGMAMLNTMCNPGAIEIPWQAAMSPDHPKFGFIVTRVTNDRMVQISNWSYVKHAFISTNSTSTCGGTCAPGTSQGTRMGLSCSDTYSQGNNSNQYYLGPPEEIDPWLGVWVPRGSYFDRGDPDVGPPANNDGARSLSQSQAGAFGPVKNRITVQEQDLLVSNSQYYYGIHLIHEGEAEANRGDNLASRQFTPSWNGSTWSVPTTSAAMQTGSILQRWTGAQVSSGRNANDDGTFFVAVKVTNPQPGRWHYEYAVHNSTNSRGGAAFRVPVCGNATISNAGCRDIDRNALNDWTSSRQADELAWLAPAGNPHNWNQIFNFWFDCNVAPVSGQVQIDEARLGPGSLSLGVATQVPGVPYNVDLGPGCGSPAPVITATSYANIPNAAWGLTIQGDPNSCLVVFNGWATVNESLGNGCFQKLDENAIFTHGVMTADASGIVQIAVPVPNNPLLQGFELSWQAAEIQTGGPVWGTFAMSNGLKVRVGNNLPCQ